MFIKLNSLVFNLAQVETIRMQRNEVVLSFRDRTVTVRERDEVEALGWLMSNEGMEHVSRIKSGVVDLVPTCKAYKNDIHSRAVADSRVEELPAAVVESVAKVTPRKSPPKRKDGADAGKTKNTAAA